MVDRQLKHLDRMTSLAEMLAHASGVYEEALAQLHQEIANARDTIHGQGQLPGLAPREEDERRTSFGEILAAKDQEIAELQEMLQDTAESVRVLRADLIAGKSTIDRAPIIATLDVMIRALQ